MSPSSLAGIVTAISAVTGLLTAIAVFIPALRGLRREVKQVHTIVNQQHTDMLSYQRALVRALLAAGISVPIDQSLPDEEAPAS